MKPDIKTANDINALVHHFYNRALTDSIIGSFFTKAVQLNWEIHIPLICQFWQSILLSTAQYKGRPIDKHIQLHKTMPIKPIHFKQWLKLWQLSIDQLFSGPIAEQAKQRAHQIADLMQFKIQQTDSQNFIQ